MAAARPLVQVYGGNGEVVGQVPSPAVFGTPIRNDLVQYVQTNLRKNRRVPYSVSKLAGTETSAESWGTGRAVARIPRVPGGGTHRAGQGAFGNMCRGGRMFSPTRTWRRWHRKVNINQKRYAVASAIAASAITALVMARGHRISGVPEIPLVVKTEAVEPLTKTKAALALLTKFHAETDVERCKEVQRHTGKARLRNRAKKIKVGPLVITGNKGATAYKAFRNLPGVQITNIHDLDLLKLAPGGHLGRFIIWTQAAFEQLNTIFGTTDKPSQVKRGYFLPRPILTNPDVRRVVQSDTILSVVGPRRKKIVYKHKPNYLTNRPAMERLNPYHIHHVREARNAFFAAKKARAAKAAANKTIKKTHKARTAIGKKRKTESIARFAAYKKLIRGEQ